MSTFTWVAKIGAALHFIGGDIPTFEAEAAQIGFDGGQIGTGIDQGAEGHVSANPEKQSK